MVVVDCWDSVATHYAVPADVDSAVAAPAAAVPAVAVPLVAVVVVAAADA